MKWKKLYKLGKDVSELIWDDFEQFPIWANCLELEDMYGETFYAPIKPQTNVPRAHEEFFVKSDFILNDETYLKGIIVIYGNSKTLDGISVLINDKLEHILPTLQFMFGYQYLCHLFGKRPEEVFPIRFRCPVGFEGEEGVIEGEYPVDFRPDRGIILVRWREHILYGQGKNALQITWQDLERFPFWACVSIFVWTDPFCAPVDLPFVPKDAGIVLLKSEFTLADGTNLKGAVEVEVWEKTLRSIMVFVDDRAEGVRSSQQLCEILGKEAREVFPVQFRCFIGFEGEEGVIEGEIPKSFSPDRPVKLRKRRK